MVTRSSENSTRFLLSGLSNMCGGAGESFNFDVRLRENTPFVFYDVRSRFLANRTCK